ncbi:MAG: hypothetical protein ABEH81_15475, partial [Halopenitus sp.]
SEKSSISREADPYLNRAVLRGSDMSLSDRERPRAFWVFALLSSAAASAPLNTVYKRERPRDFKGFALP